MSDPGFNGCAALDPVSQAFGCATFPAVVNVNLYLTFVSMTAIAHIHKNRFRILLDSLYLLQDARWGMSIVRVAVNRYGTEKPSASGGSGYRHFAAELIAFFALCLC